MQFLTLIVTWASRFGLSDRSISELFKILKESSLHIISESTLPPSTNLSFQIPLTMKKALAMISPFEQPTIFEMPTCPGCLSVYNIPLTELPINCSHVAAPLYVQASRRVECGPALLTQALASHNYPKMVYP